MNKQEWNVTFPWLMALYPAWKVDVVVSQVWYEELAQHVSVEQFKGAVRSLNKQCSSPYPPGVFEIKAELQGEGNNVKLQASKDFAYLWAYAGNRATKLPMPIDLKFAREVECMVAGGGGFGQMNADEKPWIEKRYIEIYTGMAQEKRREQLLSLGTTQEVPLLEGGE